MILNYLLVVFILTLVILVLIFLMRRLKWKEEELHTIIGLIIVNFLMIVDLLIIIGFCYQKLSTFP